MKLIAIAVACMLAMPAMAESIFELSADRLLMLSNLSVLILAEEPCGLVGVKRIRESVTLRKVEEDWLSDEIEITRQHLTKSQLDGLCTEAHRIAQAYGGY